MVAYVTVVVLGRIVVVGRPSLHLPQIRYAGGTTEYEKASAKYARDDNQYH
jgi:hypothetical protein